MKKIQKFCLRVWGDFALFTRGESKAERLSYECMTPSAARGVIEAIYWKPQITWRIDRIHVMNPVRWTNLRRNEVKSKIPKNTVTSAMKAGKGNLGFYVDDGDNRQQRASTLLRDVEYLIEAHFIPCGSDEPLEKHSEMFRRRAEKGQAFSTPYLGTREFPADFELITDTIPESPLAELPEGNRTLGWMLHDIDFQNGMQPRFFHAELKRGVVEVPPWEDLS
ncbi:Type I-C CRISPR-associated protein Cas5 [Planctomycetales bacterium 10988]|nr:Type I-C CRISPR-associated protein Cas5 [Planctomycetales bacterium 10988]